MSVKAMEWVSGIICGKASYKAVLIALAHYHHDKRDECFPSIDTLVQFTELNNKTIRGALGWLLKSGLVTFDPRSKRHRRYLLNFDTQSPKAGPLKQGHNSSNLGALKAATQSSKNGSLEPSQSPKAGPLDSDSNRPKTDFYSSKNDFLIVQVSDTKRITGLTGKEKEPPCSPPNSKLEVTETANRVILGLNQRAGKNFRLTDANRKPILARLKEGYTEQDCYRVIASRVARWHGTEMAQYLRPETLFQSQKFDGYLNDAGETGTTQQAAESYSATSTDELIKSMFGDDDAIAPDQRQIEWKH